MTKIIERKKNTKATMEKLLISDMVLRIPSVGTESNNSGRRKQIGYRANYAVMNLYFSSGTADCRQSTF